MSRRTLEISNPRFEHEDLRHLTVKSASLGRRADIVVHATPAARAAADVPVVILLHGVYGSCWAWALQGGAHRTNSRLQASGDIPPMVLVMPSDGLWGDGSGYVRHPTFDAERWIVDDVPRAACDAVPSVTAASPVCIAGLSMGGFGALRLGARHPGRFRAMAGHSSITHFAELAMFVEEPLDSYGPQVDDHSVLESMLQAPGRLPALRFDCGTADPLIDGNRALDAALTAAGVPHIYEEFAGGHEWAYWEAHLADTLRFFGSVLG